MSLSVKGRSFGKWVGVAVLVMCATAVATADTAALLYGNPQSVYLECSVFWNREVVWYHNGSMLHAIDASGQTRYQSVRRHRLDISYATHEAAGLYQCKDNQGAVLKTFSGVTVYSKLVPDNCTSERSLPCTDVTEVVVVDLPPERQQRYRISLSYHHKPAVHYPQESLDYPIQWIVEAEGYDTYKGCSRALGISCVIARCNNRDLCNASGHIAHGAGLRVTGDFGQVVEVNLTKLVPGDSNGIVELQYHANLPYRQNVEGERNIVMLKKYRFNFRGFVPNVKVWSLNCSSDHCNVSVKEGGNVTICSEMGPRSGEGPIPVNSSQWVSMVSGGRMEMISQCQEETKCCNKERCSNRILVSGEWGKCIVLTNVSMDDNGRFLSFQLQSPQDSRVSSVNYTLHVTPSVEVSDHVDLVAPISASVAGVIVLVLVLAVCVDFMCCCCYCCCRRWYRKRTEPERMRPDPVWGLLPPLPPRPSMMLAPPHEGIYVEPLPALEMASSNRVPMNHSQVQMSRRNERSWSLQVDPPLRNGPQRTVSLQAHRWPSPPDLQPPPDSRMGRSFYSAEGLYIVLPYPSRVSHPSERANYLQLSPNTAEVSSVAHSSAAHLPPVAHASTTSHWSPESSIAQSMDHVYLASESLETSDRRRSYQGTQSN